MIADKGEDHPSNGDRIIKDVVEGERNANVGKIVGKDDDGKDKLVPF